MTRLKTILAVLIALLAAAARAAAPSGSLPVLHIETANRAPIVSKSEYIDATYWLDPAGQSDVEAIGSRTEPLPLQIRGRGNYTWTGFDKKPYRLKLDKKQPLLGMPKSKHWALLAHADDNKGFLRNIAGFQLSRLLGLPWTPEDEPVEVVLNGDYIGLYFLTETIRIDKDRVDIYDYDSEVEDAEKALEKDPDNAELKAALQTARDAQPGWLVEIDNYDDPQQVKIQSKDNGQILHVTYASPEDYITDAHKEWLLRTFTDLDSHIYTDNIDTPVWPDLIDIDDAARFFITNQLTDNFEAYHGSCKLYRDASPHSTDTKWHFGPVWDFGSSFNREPCQYLFEGEVWYNHWIERMLRYPAMRSAVAEQLKTLLDDTDRYNSIYTYIDNRIAQINTAAAADLDRWPDYGNTDLTGRARDVKQKLRDAVKFLSTEMGLREPDPSYPEIYLRGDHNGWSTSDPLATTDGHTYTITIPTPAGRFKIATADWKEVDLGANHNETYTLGHTYTMVHQGSNCSLAGIDAHTVPNVTITLHLPTSAITITDPSAAIPDPLATTDEPVITTAPGTLGITALSPGTLTLCTPAGQSRTIAYPAGHSTHTLPRGIYITAGRCIAL